MPQRGCRRRGLVGIIEGRPRGAARRPRRRREASVLYRRVNVIAVWAVAAAVRIVGSRCGSECLLSSYTLLRKCLQAERLALQQRSQRVLVDKRSTHAAYLWLI